MEDKKMLNDKELDKVTGGATVTTQTHMKCLSCSYEEMKDGDYSDKTYECPSCHKKTLIGINSCDPTIGGPSFANNSGFTTIGDPRFEFNL